MRDRVFAKESRKRFEFDEEVASVFDDMIGRSVPFYKETQDLLASLVERWAPQGALVYDLGSSTGTLLLEIWNRRKDLRLVGIDSSPAMIERSRKKAAAYGADVEFVEADILEFPFEKADIFLSAYTLQFIRPPKRNRFVERICERLREGGLFLFAEKVISPHPRLDRELTEIYYDFKRAQGYSEAEITRKREALENVLVPYSEAENIEMAKEAGFSHTEMIFRWATFAAFAAIR
jgi:tRNA (cmo5U34)-methyltransferase